HIAVAESLVSLGDILSTLGRKEEAELLHRKALAIQQKRLEKGHWEIILSLHSIASLNQGLGNLPAAEVHLREALKQLKERTPVDDTWYTVTAKMLAKILREQGNPEGAEAVVREAEIVKAQGSYFSKCRDNLKTLVLSVHMYANDNEDRFPPCDKWCDAII